MLLLLSPYSDLGQSGTWVKCSQISVFCFSVLCTFLPSDSFKFPRSDFGGPSSFMNQQTSVPPNTSGVVFQLPGWSDAFVVKLPPYPGLRNDGNGSWGKGRCLSQHHSRRSPLSLTSWKWVWAWLVAVHVWVGHYISFCWAELMTFKVCLGLFWKTWMQLSQISTQICSFGLACKELNFILPVLHSQLATQNLNSFNNSPNHPIRLIIKA